MPDEVQTIDPAPGTPEYVLPGSPATEWTLEKAVAFLATIAAGTSGTASAANQATQITAEQAILAKLTADPATQTTLAAVLAKLTADPATQTTLAAILAKLIAAPATEATLASVLAKQPALGTATTPNANVITTQRPVITQVVSTALEASKVLKSSGGQLVQLSVFNSKVSAQFVLLINATAVPADGAVTLLFPPIPIPANTLLVIDFPAPLVASTGICISNSSTGAFTKTIGTADCAFYAQVN